MKLLTATMLAAAFSIATTGCATTGGAPFDRHKAVAFVPGLTKKAEVTTALGKPFSERTYTGKKDLADKDLPNAVVVNELRFFYVDRAATAAPAGAEASRNAFYTFNADTLTSYWLISTFSEDSTEFDESLVTKLVKGKSTEADVVKLLGKPAGMGVYPIAQDPQGRTLLYEVFVHRPASNQQTYKTLKVFLDKNRIVTDYDLNIRSR